MAEVYHKYVRAGETVPPPTKEQIARGESNAKFAAARARKETALAELREAEAKKRNGELIERRKVIHQAAFLFVATRQRLLALPTSLPRKLVGKTEHEMRMILDGAIRECLTELSTLPDRVTQAEYDAFNGEKKPAERKTPRPAAL